MYHEETVLRSFLKPYIYDEGKDVVFLFRVIMGKQKGQEISFA